MIRRMGFFLIELSNQSGKLAYVNFYSRISHYLGTIKFVARQLLNVIRRI